MQKTFSTASAAVPAATRWPQYRKSSHPATARELATRWLVCGTVLAAFVGAWQVPEATQTGGVRPVVHVTLQRVEIEARRERFQEPTGTDSVAQLTPAGFAKHPGLVEPIRFD